MSSHRKSTQYETADTLTFIVSQFSSPNTPRKLLSDKKRDPLNPDVLWRLKVYPNGNGTPGFLALYIDIPSKHALPEDWNCDREITFTLHHPTDPNRTIFKRTCHTFNDEEPDWGYNQIIPVIALSQRGFLQNDTIKVTATFRPVEEEPQKEAVEAPVAPIAPPPQQREKSEGPAPVSPRMPNNTSYEYNSQEDCRVIIEEFSKAGCTPVASEWRPFTPDADSTKYEWRLIVNPHAGAESVSAYIDVRAKDVKNESWEEAISASIILVNQEIPKRSLSYPLVKTFKAKKSRKGFPLFATVPILIEGGFLVNDKLCVSATASILAGKAPKSKKQPDFIDAMEMQVYGFSSYGGASSDSCRIVSPWHSVIGLGRWRFTVYPVGTKENKGFVSVVVTFQPSEELTADNDWSLRVLAQATAVCRNGTEDIKDDSYASIAVLNSKQLSIPLGEVISCNKLIEHKDKYLNWNSDDDTLRVSVMFRTCRSSGPKVSVDEEALTVCLKDVENDVKGLAAALEESLKPLVESVNKSSGDWNQGLKELEAAFKKQMEVLTLLGTTFDHKDKIEYLDRKLVAMNEQKDMCIGKGLPVEDLNAKELEMRSTLKKLLLIQTTGATPAAEEKVEDEEDKKELPKTVVVDVPKCQVEAAQVAQHNCAVMEGLHSLLIQCQRAGAMSRALSVIRSGMERYMVDVQKCLTEQESQRTEFMEKEKTLRAQVKEAERECRILRGDDDLLKCLPPEEVTKYVDFVMEAVGQVAVAKYLTKK